MTARLDASVRARSQGRPRGPRAIVGRAMRLFAIAGLVASLTAVSLTAAADPATVFAIGGTIDARGTGPTYDVASRTPARPLAGARLTLSFDDALVPLPPPGMIDHDFRLVPEVFAGFVAGEHRAEGMIGAGLRGELALASHRCAFAMRTAIYTAARGVVIGKHQDPAAELVLGEYVTIGSSTARFGWEGGAMIRPRDRAGDRELDAVLTFYVGWSR